MCDTVLLGHGACIPTGRGRAVGFMIAGGTEVRARGRAQTGEARDGGAGLRHRPGGGVVVRASSGHVRQGAGWRNRNEGVGRCNVSRRGGGGGGAQG